MGVCDGDGLDVCEISRPESPPLCGTIRQEDLCKYRISFPALEITKGAEGLRHDAEVALVLLDR